MVIAPRLPLQSGEPALWFARVRLALALGSLASVALFDEPHRVRLALVLAAVALPWSAALVVLVRRRTELVTSLGIAVGDLLVLAVIQVASPAAYGGVRFVALFLIATHAYFLGELRGLVVALAAVVLLVPAAPLLGVPVHDGILALYESLFALSAICCGVFVARIRTAESAERLRARDVSRRAMEAEAHVRRRLAESIHDGPVQELIGLDLILASIDQAIARGDADSVSDRLKEARTLTERNIGALRDEIVGLGPYAFDELTFDTAVEQCAPVWRRRFGLEVELAVDRVNLPNELCGTLFGIAQEAIANAGRHAEATRVVLTLRIVGDEVELRVSDDGHGFEGTSPLEATDPGHIGLASMRERAELIGGRLEIETGPRGTRVLVRAPLTPAEQAHSHDGPASRWRRVLYSQPR
jgi:signal transduction histidine kinase